MDAKEREPIVSKLLLVPLDDIVVFPNMNVTLTIDVGDEERVLLVPKHDGEFAKVGTVAEVTDRVRLPGGDTAVALNGPPPSDRRHSRDGSAGPSLRRGGGTRG